MKRRFGKFQDIWWLLLVMLALFMMLWFSPARAEEHSFRYSKRLQPSDYLLQSHDSLRDPVFDHYKTVDLGASIGVGSDCGRLDVGGTLRSSLKNILDTKYFGDLGRNIIAGSPMLLTCYFSPTWCAILKHSQLSANFLSQMRLDQCSLVDKYVDSRVEDFYRERQECVHRSIQSNGGDLERAMDSCNGRGIWEQNLGSWAGGRPGEKVEVNRLIEGSAKWAGFTSAEAQPTVSLVKALVGDTIVSKGNISVEYGPRRESALSPRSHLQGLEATVYERLCVQGVLQAGAEDGETGLRSLSQPGGIGLEGVSVDRQTIRALLLMPPQERSLACRKLAGSLALTAFSSDMNRALDMLSTLTQNPNLPENRRAELEQKRRTLKESVDITLSLQKSRNEPVNAALADVNARGRALSDSMVQAELKNDESAENRRRVESRYFDCADPMWCEPVGGR
ncbi:MAG: hypothetical protein JST16_05290 [Bdellovibrionales bacterium]|nr:hypothetical protein [Bdellovibrionales bacterium]